MWSPGISCCIWEYLELEDKVKCLKYFDTKYIDLSENYNELIKFASCCGHTNIVELLLRDSRVDPSAGDNEAINQASKKGHFEIVKLLLDANVNVNYVNKNGSTVLQYLNSNHLSAIVSLLLERGAYSLPKRAAAVRNVEE